LKKEKPTYYARVLSPRGIYPASSLYFEDAVYFSDKELSFSICRYKKATRGADDESYSEVEWLNPTEACLYGALMMAVDRGESFTSFYPYPSPEPLYYPIETLSEEWLRDFVKPYLLEKLTAPDILHPSYQYPARNVYQQSTDIPLPPIAGGIENDLKATGIDYELAREIYHSIDINDALVIRGINCLIKASMLRHHHQFMEAALHSLFISMEVSYRLVVRALKTKGISNPSSQDAMTYILDAFYETGRTENYFALYYKGRIRTFHPENRFGVDPHTPLEVDDYFDLFIDMLEVYAFLICDYVHPKHKAINRVRLD